MEDMFVTVAILGLAGVLGSGVLFRQKRMMTLLAAAGVLGQMMWLLLTLIDRTIFQEISSEKVYLVGAVLLLAAWLPLYKRWRLPYQNGAGSGRRDIVVIGLMLAVAGGAGMVLGANGFKSEDIVWHGYYNGDTTTLVSLVQRSLISDGLIKDNVFAADVGLEYPTLLHAGIAEALKSLGTGVEWLRLLPIMTYVQIFITVPMFFLLMDLMMPEPDQEWKRWLGVKSRWLVSIVQGGIAAYVIALSIDNFIYPQTHFFLTGAFLLLAALVYQLYQARGEDEGLYLLPAAAIALMLLLSNAVTGTAAVVLIAIYHGLIAFDRSRMAWKRGAHLLGVILWLGLFMGLTPGNSSLGAPGYSYEAAAFMLWIAPAFFILVVGSLLQLESKREVVAGVMGLSALTFVVFIFSNRPIVVDNAERFMYQGLIIGSPLLLLPVIRGWYLIRRELILSSRKLPELWAGWTAVLLLLGMIGLPAFSSLARAGDNLLRQNEVVIDSAMRQAGWWIADNTADTAIFLTSPEEPWAVPLLTGRSVVRSDFWLSAKDETLNDVANGFWGDKAAQEKTLQLADYLLLTRDERELWEPLSYDKVFDNKGVVIYDLGSG